MFEVGVVATFEAAHRLRGDFGPASRLHGHTYRAEVALRGDVLGEDGTLADLGRLRAAVDEVTGSLHLRDLDEVAGLSAANTTAERVAEHVARAVAASLAELRQVRLISVRVWESPHAWASVELPLHGS